MPTTFYIVRHGQSEGNINEDIVGTNPPLTEVGIQQAKDLAELLSSITIDAVFASDLTRAKQTAEHIASTKGLEINEFPEIRERHFGRLEGLKSTDAWKEHRQSLDEYHQAPLADQLKWKVVDDMESLEDVLERVIPFFRKISETHKDKTILMVTHANVILSLLAHFAFVESLNQLPYGSIKNTCYIKVQKEEDSFKIVDLFGISKTELNTGKPKLAVGI
ncbi:MAG: hypothetical protein COU65_00810 [Candidatus Pacebacteria bacterium CG10_big_fil_rev_8_21_14_0_10_42_12]|nr:MAG: hypothetical protein COU65_00810 [Candidatus Pacebacteria bacterium CG10_big_fil_rev_8_21_14_0_10_42_12]